MDPTTCPVDVLYRGRFDTPTSTDPHAVELRSTDAGDSSLMVGLFSRFDVWYEIDSWIEGHFLERTAPGAFKRTIANNLRTIKTAFDHGFDPTIGDKPLGPIETLKETDQGPYYEVPLLDTDYNRDFVQPALAGRLMDGRSVGSTLGASFRFNVLADEWVYPSAASESNPDQLPERTIREVRLYEFGPVVYPASPDATAGLRGLTDHYFSRSLERSGRLDRAASELQVSPPGLATGDPATPAGPLPEHPTVPTRSTLSMRMAVTQLKESIR